MGDSPTRGYRGEVCGRGWSFGAGRSAPFVIFACGLASVAAPTAAAAAAEPVGLQAPVDTPMGAGLGLQQDVHPDADTVCAPGETLFGIDVSKWQGQIDWAAVKNDGVSYAIIRATHGIDIVDEWFEYNWEHTHAQGIPVGVYQYFEPAQDPVGQADLMLGMIDEVGGLQPGDLPPVIDVESSTSSNPAQTTAAIHAWIDRVEEATGVKPIIYTGRYFWQDNVQSDDFVDYPLWIAHYTTGCPNIPAPWPAWTFHQYSSTGSVAGIAGNVDTNTFNGGLAALQALMVQDLQPPSGGFDAPTCDAVRGYAIDPAADGAPIDVLVSFDGPASDPAALVFTATASLPHDTGCDDAGCDHGFSVPVPWSKMDGQSHAVHVELAAGDGLAVAPSQIECAADLAGARLRPVGDASLDAWGFDPLVDVLALDDAAVPAPDDVAFPDTPLVVVGETMEGHWWIDTGTRRAIDDDAAAAWGIDLDAAMTWPDDSLADVPQGEPIPTARRAVRTGSGTFVVDGPVAAGEPPGTDDGADGGSDPTGDDGTDSAGGDTPGMDDTDGDTPGMDEAGGGGGCGCTTRSRHRDLGGLPWLFGLTLLAIRRSGAARRPLVL